jgi:radical SAM superfamily enzyme YgiQ (UPF0313 family)
MKILLVRPSPPKYTIGLKHIMVCEPLELEYVAAGVRGHEVEIYDMILERDLPGKIHSFKPDIVGTSSYITGVKKVKAICTEAKKFNTEILTIVGGVHATLVPQDFIDPHIDVIAMGEGTNLIGQIIEQYDQGKTLATIPGLAFPQGERLRRTPPGSLEVDTAHLPLPRRSLVEKHRHRYYYLFHQPVALMKTIFGCPFSCNFCFCWPLTGGKLYMREAESVVDELEQIETREVYFVDDTFFVDVNRLRRLRDLISARKIDKNYLAYAHSNFIVEHPHIMRDWADIGLKACIIGLESPHDDELQNYEKKATVEQNTEAIEILRKNRVDVYGSFIVDPAWSREDFARLEDYIERTGLYYLVIQPLTPLPGTRIFSAYEDKLSVARDAFEVWDMQHAVLPTSLPQKEFYRLIRRIYIRKILNVRRARHMQLRTVPPIWSKKYLRLLLGGIRVMSSLRQAHLHPHILTPGQGEKHAAFTPGQAI